VSKIECVDICQAQRLAVALTIGAAFATMAMPTVIQAAETATLSLIAAPTVSVITASVRHVVMTTIVTGSLVPREEVQVGVDLDGYRIIEIRADEGDMVKAGQMLAHLSTDMLEVQLGQNAASIAHSEAAINQARSQIAEAAASETEAVTALDRNGALQSKGIVSKDTLEQKTSTARQAAAHRQSAEQALAVAVADKSLVEANRRELELKYTKTTIRAPADGTILTRSARIGSVVSGSTGPLFTIARAGQIELSAEVPESMIGQISVGQNVTVTVQGKSDPTKGVVRLVSPTINQTTRLGTIRVALPVDANLKSGGFARGEIEIARQEAVAIPLSAIIGSDTHQAAQIVVDGRIRTRELTTGISGNGTTVIASGVAAGETVVLRAGSFVRDGQLVKPVFRSVPGDSQ
jgi:RND family efflux transporter MFP subunit